MGLISFKFALFVGMWVCIYYLVPGKHRWKVLLSASYSYYLLICNRYILYMLVTTLSAWYGGIRIERIYKEQSEQVKKNKGIWDRQEKKKYKETMLSKARIIMVSVLIFNFGILGILKYSVLAGTMMNVLCQLWNPGFSFPTPGFLLPLGISFYTFQSMGYIIDIYQEKYDAEHNPFRFALFVSFFPQIIQGPIAMYEDLAHQLYTPHEFSSENIKDGCSLILWGVFKKMIIADRAVPLIQMVTADSDSYSGTYILMVALIYALQLYADFSGGIDIVRGIGQFFGIHMAENFRRPYFSRSLTEYWHRWHITLGNWVRTYVFYPLSISSGFLKMGKNLSKKYSKHLGRVFPTSLASLITFLIIGLWHGANGKYIAFGLWNGLAIMFLELIRPWTDQFLDRCRMDRSGCLYQGFCIFGTFLLVLIGYYFDIARNFADALQMLIRSFTDFHTQDLLHWEILVQCGLDKKDLLVILAGGMIIFIASLIQEQTQKEIRQILRTKPMILQWSLIWAGILCILIFGYYGPNIDPAAFVYMQF